MKCMFCKKPCRKMYRMGFDDIELVCKACALKDPKASVCRTCHKPLVANRIYAIYTGYDDPTFHHERCYLTSIQADQDEIDDFKEMKLI